MRRLAWKSFVVIALVCGASAVALAQGGQAPPASAAPPPPLAQAAQAPSAPAKATDLRTEVLASLSDAEDKLVKLAEKFTADKLGWRPMEGVRSPSEVFMHVASGNYGYSGRLGAQRPAGLPQNLETITDKAQVVETLKQSFAFAKQAVSGLADADLSKPVRLFGRDSSYAGVLVAMVQHAHEHLGQSIAYARMNNIVPPWTEERQQQPPPAKRPPQ